MSALGLSSMPAMATMVASARRRLRPIIAIAFGAQTLNWRPEFTEVINTTAGGVVGYVGELQNFARAVLGQEDVAADLVDGVRALEIAEAIWESAGSGKPVALA